MKIPPYQQIVTPGIRLQTNPYSMNNQIRYYPQPVHSTAPFLVQSTDSFNPVIQQAVSDNTFTIIQNTSSTPLSETQKVKLGILHNRIRNAERELDNMQISCKKSSYSRLQDIKQCKNWRQAYLMQAQSDFHMHLIYDPTYVPAFQQYPYPNPSDSEWEGRLELVNAAIELYNVLTNNHEWKLNFQAMAISEAITENGSARVFVKTGFVDARQILRDKDDAFIKQNPLTKGDFITEFFNLEKRQEEMWAAFFSKVENMMIEGW